MRRLPLGLLPLFLTALVLAADPPAEKKPAPLKVGADLPGPFHPYNVNGPAKGRYHCLVSQQGLNPGVLVLVRGTEWSAGLKDLLRGLDGFLDKERNPSLNVGAFAVFVPEQVKDLVEED